MLKLKEIKNMLEKDLELSEQLKDKFFIGALTYFEGESEQINRWELNYYDPNTKKVLRYIVDDEGYDVYEGDLLNNLEEIPKDIDIIVDEEEALNKAQEAYMNNHKGKEVIGVLIALDMIKRKWMISLITKDLKAIQYIIPLTDTNNIEEKEVSLAHA